MRSLKRSKSWECWECRLTLLVGLLAIGCATPGVPVQADLFTTGRPSSQVWRYSDSGQNLGPASGFAEEWNSIARGPDGYLYALTNTLGGGALVRIHPQTLQQEQVTGPDTFPPEFTIPFGLAFGPTGTLYAGANRFVTASAGRTGVFRLDPASRRMVPFLTLGAPTDQVSDLAMGPDGLLYVAADRRGLIRVDRLTADIVDTALAESATYDFGYGGSRFVFGPGGMLYVSATDQSIHRIDLAHGNTDNVLIPAGSGGMVHVSDLHFGLDGYLYVASHDPSGFAGPGAILRFDENGTFLNTVVSNNALGGWSVAHVPEPAAGAMLILTAFALAVRRR
jgi:hypothetical protein